MKITDIIILISGFIILFIGILVYVLVLDQGEQLVSKGRMGKAYDRMVLRTWLGTLSKML